MCTIIHSQKWRPGGIIVEHIAALAVVGCCCVTIATVCATRNQLVVPARDEALAAQTALDADRMVILNPDKGNVVTIPMGSDKYQATVQAQTVEVIKVGTTQHWTFTRRVHPD